MPQSPDSEIPIYSSSDEMRSRPFERAERESARTNDPLRAAHEFLFRGSAGGSSETPSESHEVERVKAAGARQATEGAARHGSSPGSFA